MNRRTAALDLRAALGTRLILHREWGSIMDYELIAQTSQVSLEKMAGHWDGGSSVMSKLARHADPYDGEIAEMRRVDHFHKYGRGWNGGFAYGVGLGPKTGLLYEARSFWYRWGAHPGDEDADGVDNNLEIFPYYIMQGGPDVPTEALKDAHGTLTLALQQIGMTAEIPQLGHRDLYSGFCPGDLWYAYAVEGQEIDDMNDYIEAVQRSLNAAGFTDFNGDALVVDGTFGPKTESAIAKRDAAAASGGGSHSHTATTTISPGG